MFFDVESLGADGRVEYERLSRELDGCVFDESALIRYCAAVDVAAELYGDIRARGVIVDGRRSGDLVKNPATSQFLAAVLAVANLAKSVPISGAVSVADEERHQQFIDDFMTPQRRRSSAADD